MAAANGVKVTGRHDACGGGVVVVVAEQDGGVAERCLFCGRQESADKAGNSSLTAKQDTDGE